MTFLKLGSTLVNLAYVVEVDLQYQAYDADAKPASVNVLLRLASTRADDEPWFEFEGDHAEALRAYFDPSRADPNCHVVDLT